VKASSAGSTNAGKRRAPLGIVFVCLFALFGYAGSGASPVAAAVPAKGVVGYFGSNGVAAGQLRTPLGVAVNQSTGNVYVVDNKSTPAAEASQRVSVFDSSGSFLRAFGLDVVAYGPDNKGEGSIEICVPANGDTCKGGITNSPTLQSAGGAFSAPQGVAVNQATGDVYVSDQANLRVQQFDASGNFIRAFGRNVVTKGPGNAGSAETQSLTIRANSGSFRLSFGNAQTGPLPFNAPATGPGSVEEALNNLATIGGVGGSVSVTGGPGDATGSNPYLIVFGGELGGEDVAQIVLDSSTLGVATGTTLTCSTTTAAASINFQWLRNGVPIGGGTSSTYTTTGADAGASIQCQVTALNANAGSTQVSNPRVVASPAPATAAPLAPTATLSVSVTGSLAVGSTPSGVKLTCASGTWGGAPTSFSYQWYRNGVALSGNGAGTNQYTVQTADLATAAVFQCAVTGTNAGGSASKATNNQPTTPAPSPAAPPNNTGAPVATVSGDSGVATITSGVAVFEICNAAAGDVCRAGLSGSAGGEFKSTFSGHLAVAPSGAPNAGDLLVADPGNRRIQEFTSSGAFVRAFGFDVTTGGVTTFEVCTVAASCKEAGASGSGSGQFATNTPTRVAEDSSGNIYTVEPTTNFRVQKFTLPSNVPTPQGSFDEADLKGTAATNTPTDVAVNPANGDVLVNKLFPAASTPSCPITGVASGAESRVVEVSSAGALEGTHGICAGVTPSNGLAVRGSTGDVYVSSTFAEPRVYVLNTGQPVAPTATITNVSGITAHGATVNALINPGGPELPYGTETTYKVEYRRSDEVAYSSLFNLSASAGNRTTAKAITASLDGLRPGTSYDVRLTATKGLGSGSATATVSFSTADAGPDVSLPDYVPVTMNRARLEGTVNPNGAASGYHFDYVDQARFEADGFSGATRVPASDVSAGAGFSAAVASQEISGLKAGTTYRFRLTATSGFGQDFAEGSFSTPSDPGGCPNAQLRSEQVSTDFPGGSTSLPDCMAFEMVTPPKKFNQPVAQGSFSANGNRVEFGSLAALEGIERLGFPYNRYIATRTTSGWATTPTAPPTRYTTGYSGFAIPCVYTPDLSRWTTYAATAGQATLGIATVLQNTIGGHVFPLSPTLVPQGNASFTAVGSGGCQGGSADGSRYVLGLDNSIAYLPGDPGIARGVSLAHGINLYETHLDPSGSPAAPLLLTRDRNGKVYGGGCGAQIGDESRRGAISPDGSRLFITTRPDQTLSDACVATAGRTTGPFKIRILKRALTSTGPEISEVVAPECTRISPPCSPTDANDTYWGASQEGDRVFFTSARQLTNSDRDTGIECGISFPGSPGCDLYLSDSSLPAGARLTQVSAGNSTATRGLGAEVLGVPGIAGDGSRAYFVAKGVLTTVPNAVGRSAEVGRPNLYLYERDETHPSGRTAFIGTLASTDKETWEGNTAAAVPMLGENVEDQSVGGDGHILVFLTTASLTPDDTDGGKADVYRYDSVSGDLERVSKATPGSTGNGAFDVSNFRAGVSAPAPQMFSFGRKVSEDGGSIVFTTSEPLDATDTDSEETAYVWREGNITPIPGGTAPAVSMGGTEILFQSYGRLLRQDGDTITDIYVARADGGYPIPVDPIPCEGEACQGAPGLPSSVSSGTSTASGEGNVKPGSKKPHKKHGKNHKSKHRHNQKRSGHDQGGQK
jgi:hypothetical protein